MRGRVAFGEAREKMRLIEHLPAAEFRLHWRQEETRDA